jgi:hypothetical protein
MIWPTHRTRFCMLPNHVRDGLEHRIGCLFEVDNVLGNMVECDEVLTKVLGFAGGLDSVLSHRKSETKMIELLTYSLQRSYRTGNGPDLLIELKM